MVTQRPIFYRQNLRRNKVRGAIILASVPIWRWPSRVCAGHRSDSNFPSYRCIPNKEGRTYSNETGRNVNLQLCRSGQDAVTS
jgi:hypothetical protein